MAMNISFSCYEMKNTEKCKTWRELHKHVNNWVFDWNFCLRPQLKEHISRNQIQYSAIHTQSTVVGSNTFHVIFLASTIKGIVSMGKLAFVNARCLRDWKKWNSNWMLIRWISRKNQIYTSRSLMSYTEMWPRLMTICRTCEA